MSHLHLDGIVYSLQRQGGISVYFNELLARLCRDAHPLTLTLEGTLQQEGPAKLLGTDQRLIRRAARPLERYLRSRSVGPTGGGEVSLFHSSYYRMPADPHQRSVVTVHDFAYERLQHGPRKWLHSWQKVRAIRQATHLICISEATRDDLMELVGIEAHQTLHVIPNGVAETFRPLHIQAQELGSQPFVLFVGQRDGYKNFKRLLEAFSLLPADIELRCVGGGPLRPQELAGLSSAVRQRVKHLGYVDDAALNCHYNEALCLAYVSRYEGFGIPVIEAMRAGCPVLSIASKAVLEVGGDALLVVEDAAESMAKGILQLAQSDERSQRRLLGFQVAARYHWEQTYAATLAVYRAAGYA